MQTSRDPKRLTILFLHGQFASNWPLLRNLRRASGGRFQMPSRPIVSCKMDKDWTVWGRAIDGRFSDAPTPPKEEMNG